MKIDLALTVEDLESFEISDKKVVVVIDVLRATSTMITAFANKANSIISYSEIEKAVSIKKIDSNSLLCGERDGKIIPGFDKGNSPSEYEDLDGVNLVFSSTNGSKTIDMSKESKKMYLGAFLNAKYLIKYILKNHPNDDILFACSGKLGRVCIEDTLCAGYMVSMLCEKSGFDTMDDASKIAVDYYDLNKNNIIELVKNSEHGQYLVGIGFEKDIDYCCQRDIIDLVPYFDKKLNKLVVDK